MGLSLDWKGVYGFRFIGRVRLRRGKIKDGLVFQFGCLDRGLGTEERCLGEVRAAVCICRIYPCPRGSCPPRSEAQKRHRIRTQGVGIANIAASLGPSTPLGMEGGGTVTGCGRQCKEVEEPAKS